MTVYEMLDMCNQLYDTRIRIFDCNSEEIIFDSDKLDPNEDILTEIYLSDKANYEVGSYDLYLDNGVINLEMNIEYEPDDEEE